MSYSAVGEDAPALPVRVEYGVPMLQPISPPAGAPWWLAAMLTASLPAAATGALAGAYLGSLGEKSVQYAKWGAAAGAACGFAIVLLAHLKPKTMVAVPQPVMPPLTPGGTP